MGQKFFDIHESSRFNMSFKCSGEFNIIYIMRTIMTEDGKQPASVNQSYNQRPALADAMSIPIWTAVGVTWLAGFDFEIKVIARIP
ncbi:hypothetical protein DM350_06775 [Salmonella enterica subsp. enterica serovar Nagoya]|nr:hypothetical protein [Salmonella enterica subsp. enterica serovar Nagoya]ECC3318810.1 hypothetical protein [Salmonella enterica subsp. enterica]EBQ9719526.1 hypothetical protein [Salmonella enterica subsp. enterica serovar Nagoya]EBR8519565.1 hypothetical protein [Salmonella enterica subsp. enterica serovar Nagoya]EBW2496677.1 hypothetical protein [Salmonella enterica subsp. enterica serovar Nagoya]